MAPQRDSKHILVVDDEESVREVARVALTRSGARVIEAVDGTAALRYLGTDAGAVTLILLDLTMPGITGEETLRRLRMLNHRHKVVVMSGYSEAATAKRCMNLGAVGFLAKPFEIAELVAAVREHLG